MVTEFNAQYYLVWVPKQTIQALGLVLLPHKGRKANLYSHLLLSIIHSPESIKLDQRTQATEKPIPQPHLGREPNLQS